METILSLAEFVVSEIDRLGEEIENMDLRNHPKASADMFYTIPAPGGIGHWVIGREGQRALEKLLVLYCQQDERFDYSSLLQRFKKGFSGKFLSNQCDLSDKYLKRLLAKTKKEEEESWCQASELYPCTLFVSDEMQSICIGPVLFVPMNDFLKMNEDGLSCPSPDKDEYSLKVWHKLQRETLAYFSRFDWVAVVEVDKCAGAVRGKISNDLLDVSIAVLQLIFGIGIGKYFFVGNNNRSAANWSITKSNNYFFYGWSGARGSERLHCTWPLIFHRAWEKSVIDNIASLLGKYSKFETVDSLDRAVVKSLSMYKKSLEEEDYYLCILKMVISLETLILPMDYYDNVSMHFEKRAAMWESCDMSTYEERCSFYKKVYSIRSIVAHGNKRSDHDQLSISICELDKRIGSILFGIIALINHQTINESNVGRLRALEDAHRRGEFEIDNAVKQVFEQNAQDNG